MEISFPQIRTEQQLHSAEKLATEIWQQHYTPIIGEDQVSYMLDKFQSVKAMSDQLSSGYHYHFISVDGQELGYLSFRLDKEELFLSKIYLLQSQRGKGLGRKAMAFVEERAKLKGLKALRLTVNKYNSRSIEAYQGLGFEITKPVVFDIGGGFIMDDYEMRKTL